MVLLCILAAILVSMVQDARANPDVTIMSGFLSQHSGSNNISNTTGRPYNENNHGIGLKFNRTGWMVGTYLNSHDKYTLYVGKEWVTSKVGPFQLGVVAAVGTGYNSFVMPAVLPEFIVNMWRAQLVFIAQPFKVSSSTSPMVAVQLRWNIWK